MDLLTLFGLRKKRRCDRRKKSCRRPRRYNVPGSPCNKLKRKTCRSKSDCSYVKRRGCRRAKGFAKLVASGSVPVVNAQVAEAGADAAAAAAAVGAPIADQALAAAAAAADAAAANVASVGGTVKEETTAAIEAAAVAAEQVVDAAGADPAQAAEIVNVAIQAIAAAPPPPPPPPPPKKGGVFTGGIGDLAAQAAAGRGKLRPVGPRTGSSYKSFMSQQDKLLDELKSKIKPVEFGRRRRYAFGNRECVDLPRSGNLNVDIGNCLNFRNAAGNYPCNWSGGANNRCQRRGTGPVSYAIASTVGKYTSYVMAISPALATMTPPPPVVPVAPVAPPPVTSGPRGMYNCVGRDAVSCGSNPNCQWQANAKPPRCVRRAGHLTGTQYEGPMGPSDYNLSNAEIAASEASELMFGRRRFGKGGCGNTFMKRDPVTGKCVRKSVTGLTKALGKKAGQGAKIVGQGSLAAGRALGQGMYATANVMGSLASMFGKKRRSVKHRKKLPSKIRKLCRKLKIKTTKKVGNRRVYKTLKVLKKQIARKMKVHHRRR